MELTDKQKKKLLAAASIVEEGDVAVLTKLLEFEETLENNTQKIDESVTQAAEVFKTLVLQVDSKLSEVKDGDKGDDYVLTDQDKKDIAGSITVPVVEKVIEKTETIREIPIVTENIIKEIKEVAKKDDADDIRNKLETLKEDSRLDASAIKGLTNEKKLREDLMNHAIAILDQRSNFGLAKADQMRKELDQKIWGINTQRLTVSATAPVNPQLNDLWYDIS
jgi:hypothetical protein